MNTKTETAFEYIVRCCPRIGAFFGTSDVNRFIHQTAVDLAAAPPTPLFPDRYGEHAAYALEQVAMNMFTSSPAALAAEYLLMRFEFYFRLLSGKLTEGGEWLNPADADAILRAIGANPRRDRRLSNVARTYKVMKLNVGHPAADAFARLDRELHPDPVDTALGSIGDVGDRIACARHPCGHGPLGDMSSEAIFYGLLTSIIFYNQT